MTGYFVFQSTALILLSIISTLAVALRMWARKIQRTRLISADYLIVVGLVRGNSPYLDVSDFLVMWVRFLHWPMSSVSSITTSGCCIWEDKTTGNRKWSHRRLTLWSCK